MLATSLFHPQHHHLPSRPSPLSERSSNAVLRPFQFTMASPAQNDKKTPVAQRAFKPNPVMQTRDAATKRRRDMFFKRVQKERDDKMWQARGEQIQRLDHLSEQKRWEAEKAREAPQLEDEMLEEVMNEVASSSPAQQLEEVDYILAQEEHELQELIASMEEEEDNASQHYGSDDEDYDQLFSEYASTASDRQQQQQTIQHMNADYMDTDADAMDMS